MEINFIINIEAQKYISIIYVFKSHGSEAMVSMLPRLKMRFSAEDALFGTSKLANVPKDIAL